MNEMNGYDVEDLQVGTSSAKRQTAVAAAVGPPPSLA